MESEEMPEEFLSDPEDDTEDDGAERDAGRKPKRERHANEMKSFEREYSPFRKDREFLEFSIFQKCEQYRSRMKVNLTF
uniref:Uncharacterized protein n=1 Tax=Globodera rostochiensis TaxID=31243 RepID=A0A914I2L1_GLORO